MRYLRHEIRHVICRPAIVLLSTLYKKYGGHHLVLYRINVKKKGPPYINAKKYMPTACFICHVHFYLTCHYFYPPMLLPIVHCHHHSCRASALSYSNCQAFSMMASLPRIYQCSKRTRHHILLGHVIKRYALCHCLVYMPRWTLFNKAAIHFTTICICIIAVAGFHRHSMKLIGCNGKRYWIDDLARCRWCSLSMKWTSHSFDSTSNSVNSKF